MTATQHPVVPEQPPSRSEEIRAVAAKLFYQHGYNAVGMRMIADAAGVRPASLYHHFASKEEMLYQIILEVTRDFIDAHLPLLDGGGPRPARLENLLEQHVKYFWEHRYSMSVGLREMRNLGPENRTEVHAHRIRYQHRIQAFIADGVSDGEFQCEDPALTGLALLDMVNGVNSWFSENGRYSLDDLARHHARLAVQNLLGARHLGDG